MVASESAAHFLGAAVQPTAFREAAITDFIYLPMKAGGLSLDRPSKPSDELYGYEHRLMRAQNSSFSGSLPLLMYYNLLGRFFDNFLYRQSTEVSSYVIAGTNNKLYFVGTAGAATATIPSLTYTTTTLATAIALAMNTADAGQDPNYTCTYSTSTKKFTIAAVGGTAFVLTLSNGSNAIWSTIGFTGGVDTSSATTHTGASQAAAIWDHLWTPQLTAQFVSAQKQENGLTLLDHRDWFTYQGVGGMINNLAVGYAEGDPHAPGITFGVKGATLERVTAVTPSFSTDVPANPDGRFIFTAVVNGETHTGYPTKNFNLQVTPAVDLRYQIGDFYPRKAVHTGKITYNASFAWDLEDEDSSGSGSNLNEDFETAWLDPDATAALTVTHTGETLRGAVSEGLTIFLPVMRPTGGTSQAALGTIEQPFSAMGQYDRQADDPGLQITVRSTEAF